MAVNFRDVIRFSVFVVVLLEFRLGIRMTVVAAVAAAVAVVVVVVVVAVAVVVVALVVVVVLLLVVVVPHVPFLFLFSTVEMVVGKGNSFTKHPTLCSNSTCSQNCQ